MRTADPFKPVVIAPTYNNEHTLASVLRGVARLGLQQIIVDDGSTDATAGVLDQWRQSSPGDVVLTHADNMGKAAALRSGFARARRMGFTHAVTIDTDAQLDPAQIPELLEAAHNAPDALIVGSRDSSQADYPVRSRLGRWASNLLVRLESGAKVSDSQCGFRVYPLPALSRLHCRAGRYGFETEIITRAAWAGIPIHQPPVRCTYHLPAGRVSHFRPWRDSLAALRMHLHLLTASLWPWPAPPREAITGKPWWRGARWLSPRQAWRTIRCHPEERPRFAAGLAIGVFIANLPLFGVQTLLSLYTARRFKLNPVPIVLGSQISTPPVGPVLIATAIALGHWMTHGTLPKLESFNPAHIGYLALLQSVAVDWTLGGIVCGAVLGGFTFALMRCVLHCIPVRKPASSAVDRHEAVAIPAGAIPESVA